MAFSSATGIHVQLQGYLSYTITYLLRAPLYTGCDKQILNLLFGLFMHGVSLCLQNHNLPFRKVMHRIILKINAGFNAQRVAANYDCRYFLVGPLITKISRI